MTGRKTVFLSIRARPGVIVTYAHHVVTRVVGYLWFLAHVWHTCAKSDCNGLSKLLCTACHDGKLELKS